MKHRDIFLAILITFFWGSNWVFMKTGLEHFSPFVFNVGRALLVSLLLLPFIRLPRRRIGDALVMGMIFGIGHFTCVVLSLSYGVDISAAVILGQTSVPLSCILGVVFLGDTLGRRRIFALMVAFLGVIIFAGTPNLADNMLGFWVITCAFTSWAIINVYAKARLHDVPPTTRIGWATLFSFPVLLVMMLYTDGVPTEMLRSATALDWGCLVYSAIFPLLIANVLWQYLLRTYTVSMVAPFALLVPCFGTFFGVVMFDEVFTQNMMIGGAFIMTGVATIVWRQPCVQKLGEHA